MTSQVCYYRCRCKRFQIVLLGDGAEYNMSRDLRVLMVNANYPCRIAEYNLLWEKLGIRNIELRMFEEFWFQTELLSFQVYDEEHYKSNSLKRELRRYLRFAY